MSRQLYGRNEKMIGRIVSCWCTCVLLSVVIALPVSAQTRVVKPSEYSRFEEISDVLIIEKKLVQALSDKKNGKSVLKKFADEIRDRDGEFLAYVMTVVSKQDSESFAELAMKLGPCHYAGMLIRVITLGVEDQSLSAVFKDGFWVLGDGGSMIDLFEKNMRFCETLKRSPLSKRLIRSEKY